MPDTCHAKAVISRKKNIYIYTHICVKMHTLIHNKKILNSTYSSSLHFLVLHFFM